MSKRWAGISAGLIAGAAGATAKNAVSYLDQSATGSTPPSSPAGAADAVLQTGAAATEQADATRAAALGPIGGLTIGVGVGALAGLTRGMNATPPPAIAAAVTGLVAMGIGDGLASVSGSAKRVWSSPSNVIRDALSHLVYGAVTGYALHRMLDPQTPTVSRRSRKI